MSAQDNEKIVAWVLNKVHLDSGTQFELSVKLDEMKAALLWDLLDDLGGDGVQPALAHSNVDTMKNAIINHCKDMEDRERACERYAIANDLFDNVDPIVTPSTSEIIDKVNKIYMKKDIVIDKLFQLWAYLGGKNHLKKEEQDIDSLIDNIRFQIRYNEEQELANTLKKVWQRVFHIDNDQVNLSETEFANLHYYLKSKYIATKYAIDPKDIAELFDGIAFDICVDKESTLDFLKSMSQSAGISQHMVTISEQKLLQLNNVIQRKNTEIAELQKRVKQLEKELE